MLDRSKLLAALSNVSDQLFVGFADELEIAAKVWAKIAVDTNFAEKITERKHALLVPKWQGNIAHTQQVKGQVLPYAALAVDGSQIYYDKHQGPPCYLINTGFVQLRYGLPGKSVFVGSEPKLFTRQHDAESFGSTDYVNMQREQYEFEIVLEQCKQMEHEIELEKAVCLFDGSLIFFHLDTKDIEVKEQFLDQYCHVLDQLYQKKILVAGYMSFPKCKELVNLCRLELAQFDDSLLDKISVLNRLTDADIAGLFLKPGMRSTIFASIAPITYLYPLHLKPYFCYVHVGKEIVRVEFPAWIAEDETLVDRVCGVAFDQAEKGRGYPVCLFEAHEQAVVKAADREFFYAMLRQMSIKQAQKYLISQKSSKKQQPLI